MGNKKTRKNCKKNNRNCAKDAKKGTLLKCQLKTCRSKKYTSIYGATGGGSIRSERQLFF